MKILTSNKNIINNLGDNEITYIFNDNDNIDELLELSKKCRIVKNTDDFYDIAIDYQDINAINTIVLELDPIHKEFYDKCFRKGMGKYRICMDMFLAEATFYRYKDKIINDLAKELGYL